MPLEKFMVQAFVTLSADRHPARRAGDRLAHPTMLMPSPVVALPGGTPVLRRRSTDNETILIIDDSPANLTVLGELLQGAGYRVKVANSGATGLHLAVQEPRPALILLDIMMPAMDGHEVLMLLRDNPQTRDTPVIFLTARDSDADEERAFNDGIADYIVKPIKPTIVLARVRSQLLVRQARHWLQDQNQALEAEVARRMRENELIQAVSIRALAHLAETRDNETGDHIQRFTGRLPPGAARKQLPPLVDDRDQLFLADKLPRHAAQKRRFAAAWLAYEKHPDEMRLHGCTQFLWERDSFLPRNA